MNAEDHDWVMNDEPGLGGDGTQTAITSLVDRSMVRSRDNGRVHRHQRERLLAPQRLVDAYDIDGYDHHDVAQAMWQDFVVAGRTSNWQSSGLGQHATGIALQKLTRGLYTDHQNGVVTRGEPVLDPSVSSAEPATNPTTVAVTDCGDSTNFLKYDAETGQLVDDEPGGRQLIDATVELQPDGSWKVSDFGIHEVGSCG